MTDCWLNKLIFELQDRTAITGLIIARRYSGNELSPEIRTALERRYRHVASVG